MVRLDMDGVKDTWICFLPEHLKMRRRPGWVWWSAPNMNCCNRLMFSMRRRVSSKTRVSLWNWLYVPSLFPICYRKSITREHFIKTPLSSIGEFVAQFKFTVLLMPNGPMRITSGPFDPDLYKSEMEVQDAELKVSVVWKVVSTWDLSWKWGLNVSKVLKKSYNFEVRLFPPNSSKCVFLLPIVQALLQSSASRKTQKKKKKKVCCYPSLAGWAWSLFHFPGSWCGIDFCISLFRPFSALT